MLCSEICMCKGHTSLTTGNYTFIYLLIALSLSIFNQDVFMCMERTLIDNMQQNGTAWNREWIKISALDCKINNLTTRKKNKNSAAMYTVYIIYHVANPEWYSTTLLEYYIVSSRQTIYCWFRWRYWLTTKKSSKLVSGQSTWPMTSFPPPWISL